MIPLYTLHDIPIRFQTDDQGAAQRIQEQWRPFLGESASSEPIHIALSVTDAAPDAPAMPVVSAGPDVTYYRQGQRLVALFPGWGRFDVRLDGDDIAGIIARAAIQTYGVFEDMILIALAPLLRRRGYYTIHAFAAAVGEEALVIFGDVGAGKTTTGISLLARSAKLLANDTPLMRLDASGRPRLYAYPGLISAYPDSIARFPQLRTHLQNGRQLAGSDKLSFAAEAIWPDVWALQARPGALVFPRITPGLSHSHLQPMSAFDALQRLISQSIEDWDAATIPSHLRALRKLVETAPAWHLHLAPDITRLPDLLLPLISHQ